MVAKELEVGDLVWAKMKGFPAWPAKIIEPPADSKSPKQRKAQHYVYFFGSDNHAWILDENIVPHAESMLQCAIKKKSAAFQSAVEAIINCSKNNVKEDEVTASKVGKDAQSKVGKGIGGNGTVGDDGSGVKDAVNDTPKSKVIQIVNNFAKKRDGKIQKKLQTKKVKIIKVKKGIKKRPSDVDNEGSKSERSSSYPKVRKTDSSHEYSALVASVPPSMGFSPIATIEAYEDNSHSHQPHGILTRPSYVERPPTPTLDIETVSEVLKTKHVKPTKKKIGFLGLGIMGRGIVKNLLNSGHYVTVWNRTPEKCESFVKAGAYKGLTPADVVAVSDITFCCVSDPEAAKSLVFGNCGVMTGLDTFNKLEGGGGEGKGYVEMTSIDPETSLEIAEAITMKGARYLEAPISGSKKEAEEGSLFILAAGERSLFTDCETCFHAMGKHAYYISCEIGSGSKMNLILSMLHGTAYAALAESMALIDRAKLSQENFLQILECGTLNCEAMVEKGRAIYERNFTTSTPLKHMQKDLNLALTMGNYFDQPMPLVAAANEVYKHAKLLRYSDHDVCAVYQGAKY